MRTPLTQPARGFTLVELLVAVTAGLFVAVASFALAKQGSQFFQQEARIANAQFAATLGFDRMRADIARAGYMASPNIQQDPTRCPGGPIDANWPHGLRALSAVRIARATPAAAQDALNGFTPDQITLAGSYASVESFPVRTVVDNGGSYSVYLQTNTGAMLRTSQGDAGAQALANIFKAGRLLRIQDSAGMQEYGKISAFALSAGGIPTITLTANPVINFRNAGQCGIEGLGVGVQANVINLVRYEIRDLTSAPPVGYEPLFPEAGAPDPTRRDLVRVEVDSSSETDDDLNETGNVEIVAEWAVDLKFGVTYVDHFGPVNINDPVLDRLPAGDSQIDNLAFDVSTQPTVQKGPNRLRAILAHLTVRSREADRTDNVSVTTGNGPLFVRYALPNDGGFARERTLTADIELPNLAGVTW